MSRPNFHMEFWTKVEMDAEIDRVDLAIRFINGATIARRARWDADREMWQTRLETDQYRMPAWTPFDFGWCANDTTGQQVCTDYQRVQYWDPNQEWFRLENDYAILYWYGFREDNPKQFARDFSMAIAAAYPRLVEGFGEGFSYRPIVVVYPDRESISRGVPIPLATNGTTPTSPLNGVASVLLAPVDLLETCPYLPNPDGRTLEWRINFSLTDMLFGVSTLLLADTLGQPGGCRGNDGLGCVNIGSELWAEGQLVWFSGGFWEYDQRLRDFAEGHNIPGLRVASSSLVSEDGCWLYTEDMGASFINWLVYNYGGIDVHRQIVDLMKYNEDGSRGMDFEDAIQQATGKPFAELENKWRAYLELPPLE
jgi:hypothetical protein